MSPTDGFKLYLLRHCQLKTIYGSEIVFTGSILKILKMTTDTKPKGPASYFPSIEKTYGQPMAYQCSAILQSVLVDL
jgi:hypothetical protein